MKTIFDLIASYADKLKDDRIFLKPHIPDDKLSRAIKHYGGDVKKNDVLLLLDSSVFGSNRSGLIITAESAYSKRLFIFSEPTSYKFSEIKNIDTDEKCAVLFINDNYFLDVNLLEKSARINLLVMLQELIGQDATTESIVGDCDNESANVADDSQRKGDVAENPQDSITHKNVGTPKVCVWAAIYFAINALSVFLFSFSPSREDGGTGSLIRFIALIEVVPLFLLVFKICSHRAWSVLRLFLVVEFFGTLIALLAAFENPFLFYYVLPMVLFGITLLRCWENDANLAHYGVLRETIKNKNKFDWRRSLTKAIILDSAMTAYENAGEKKQKAILEAGVRLGLLAMLNPEKTKKVKELLTSSEKSSAQERLNELKTLRQNQLITAQEYEAKKSEILSQL